MLQDSKSSCIHKRLLFHDIEKVGFFDASICYPKLYYGKGNGNSLQYSCLENPVDRGAWWAAVHGVAQSRTWLTRLSSSSSSRVGLKWIIKNLWVILQFQSPNFYFAGTRVGIWFLFDQLYDIMWKTGTSFFDALEKGLVFSTGCLIWACDWTTYMNTINWTFELSKAQNLGYAIIYSYEFEAN